MTAGTTGRDVLAALRKVEAKGILSTAHDLQQMAGQVQDSPDELPERLGIGQQQKLLFHNRRLKRIGLGFGLADFVCFQGVPPRFL